MTRSEIAHDTARALRTAAPLRFPALLGFDGFVDDIIDVVAERPDAGRYDQYERIGSLAEFGNRIAATAGHGTNFELVVKRQKLGGQGPIMGNALSLLGLPVTYVGSVGDGRNVHKVFDDFATRATVISLGEAARTHALEFTDGKLMMGELASLSRITFASIIERIGRDQLIGLCGNGALLGLLNWTMLPFATAIWRGFAEEIVPKLPRPPRVFIDLADPRKRSAGDLVEAMQVLTRLNKLNAPVTLGLNETESKQVAVVLQIAISGKPAEIAGTIREKLRLDTVVIHSTGDAVVSTAGGAANFDGPYVKNPAILTGGGDHFNAGFALAQLLQLPLENALCLGTAASGYYVRHAVSPSREALAEFLEVLPEPQAA